ncbi:MAG: hypothetical protein LBM28_06315 [Oscillospiraceae bacterium]|jgi:hypothetical protein|nr:hypothetical protein [Oscillospiraceae bacterium]
MKTFVTPYVDVKKFDVEDILTTSAAEETTEETPPSIPNLTATGYCMLPPGY